MFCFKARQRLDLGATYDVPDAAGRPIGEFRKDFGRSLLRSTWHLRRRGSAPSGQERQHGVALLRRVWELLPVVGAVPSPFLFHFDFVDDDGSVGADVAAPAVAAGPVRRDRARRPPRRPGRRGDGGRAGRPAVPLTVAGDPTPTASGPPSDAADPTPAAGRPSSAEVDPVVVVDAANVVGARPDGWWRDRAGAARRLVERLAAAAALPHPGDPPLGHVVVVLEGRARPGVPAGPWAGSNVHVVHADGDGDDALVHEVEQITKTRPTASVRVVTSDAELRRRVTRLGAEVTGPRWLYELLDRAGRQEPQADGPSAPSPDVPSASPRKNRSIAAETSGPDGSV